MSFTPYLTLPFSFKEETWKWVSTEASSILSYYVKNSPSVHGLVDISSDYKSKWISSKAWDEILNFFKPLQLEPKDIQFFCYQKPKGEVKDIRGNPHIDTTGPDIENGHKIDVPFRFNILLCGEENQKMVWWDIDRYHPDIVVHEFLSINNTKFKILRPKGKRLGEKYKTVGDPLWHCDTLSEINKKSSFVRTDILHALHWTGTNARLVLSLRFFEPWSFVENLRSKLTS